MELQWPLILFTLFMAWSAGVFAAQAVYALRGQGAKAQMPALFTSLALLVIGGIAVFLHLEHWERIFNGFGHITSGITQELIAIVVLVIVMVLYFVYLRRTGDDDEPAKVPAWVAVLAIIAAAALCIVMAHSYMMPARPAWSSFLWVCAVLGNACVLGPATFALIAALRDGAGELDGPLVLGGAIVNAVCSAAYLGYLATIGGSFTQVEYYFDLTHPTKGIESFASPFAGDTALIIWLGVVLVGLVAPLACAVLGRKQANWKVWGTAAVVCAVIGALCLRVVFYVTGQSVFMFY